MRFDTVIGQTRLKDRLRRMADEGRIPHALLLAGAPGTGALPLALAFAQYVCCPHRHDGEACGECPSCRQFAKFSHPDLHFVFPIYKPKSGRKYVCDDFVADWRAFLQEDPYFGFNDWMTSLGAANAQGTIYAEEGNEILRKLTLKSYESEYKTVLVWLPEKMHPSCSNHLLKIIEEPPEKTLFLLVSETPEQVLGTIRSRSQLLPVKGIEQEPLAAALSARFPWVEPEVAASYARLAGGDWLRARELVVTSEEDAFCLDRFAKLMRGAYTIARFSPDKRLQKQDAVLELRSWSEEMAKIGRERQKHFCQFAQRLVRENFVLNLGQPQLSYLSPAESAFSSKFFPFINQGNVERFMEEFQLAEQHIEQNVYAKMVFFDLAVRAITLFK